MRCIACGTLAHSMRPRQLTNTCSLRQHPATRSGARRVLIQPTQASLAVALLRMVAPQSHSAPPTELVAALPDQQGLMKHYCSHAQPTKRVAN